MMSFRYMGSREPIKVGSGSYSSSTLDIYKGGTSGQTTEVPKANKYQGINLLVNKLKLENGARLSDSDVAVNAPPIKKEASELIPDGYKVDRLLGQGRYSRVYKALDPNDKLCTIKVYRHKAKQWLIENEITILKKLSCCNLIQHYIAHFSDEEETIVIMDFFEGHTLKRYITPDTMDYNLDLHSLLCIALNLFRALDFIFNMGIAHRDIKPDNLIYNPITKETKVIDLGLGTIITTYDKQRVGGTPIYKPPEILKDPDAYGQDRNYRQIWHKHDIWSAGVTLCNLAIHGVLFSSREDVPNYEPGMIDDYNLVPIIANMVKFCLTVDPYQRPTAQDVLQEYFTSTATIQV